MEDLTGEGSIITTAERNVQQKGDLKELQLTHNVFKNMHHLTRAVTMITITIPNNIVHLSPSELQNWFSVHG